jgi:hypothetical protein
MRIDSGASVRAQQRFWSNVKIGAWPDCWTWEAYCNPLGYGRFRDARSQKVLAHRFIFALVHGPIPDGLFVLHRCDNPGCVNPDHLWLGTIADNNADRNKKRRQARGSRHGRAKLTRPDVLKILKLHSCGFSDLQIAERYDVHSKTIYQIVHGITWRHITHGGNA